MSRYTNLLGWLVAVVIGVAALVLYLSGQFFPERPRVIVNKELQLPASPTPQQLTKAFGKMRSRGEESGEVAPGIFIQCNMYANVELPAPNDKILWSVYLCQRMKPDLPG